MVNASHFPCQEIVQGYFSQLLATKNQRGKAISGQLKWKTWKWKMVSFLGLTNNCMINQCTPDYAKSERKKMYSQNVLTRKVSRVANISCKLVVNDITKPMPQVANTSSIIVVKGTSKTHKQKAELFYKAFTLLFHCVYQPWS